MRASYAVLGLFLLGCHAASSSSNPATSSTATVTGTVDAVPFVPTTSVGLVETLPASMVTTGSTDGNVTALLVVVSDSAGLCAATKAPGTTALVLQIFTPGTTLVPTTFTAVASSQNATPPFANASFQVFDGTCRQTLNDSVIGGTVTVTATDGVTASGTFDLVFAGGTLSGSFGASLCLPPSWVGIC